ncbi:MAG: M13 family metallopeptidase [Proteobacteria bacterium]|nr:M13 family metallopeptidase [Pseudomonadota bacterium]
MRKPLCILIAAALTIATAQAAPPPATTPASPAPASTAAAATSSLDWTPVHEAGGIDLNGMDVRVKPGDDFDAYANGRWEQLTPIPADRSSISVFYLIFQRAEQRNADLLKELAASHPAAGTDARRIADYYAAYMDEAAIEKAGLTPLTPTLANIDAIANVHDLSRALGEQLRADVDPVNATHLYTDHLFGLFVAQAMEDPAHNMPYLLQGGLGLPSRDYYLSNDATMAGYRTKYLAYIADLLTLAGVKDAQGRAQGILDLETKIATAQASIVDSEDVHKANHPWLRDTFATRAPGMDWDGFFKAAGLDREQVVTPWQADAVRGLSALVASQALQTWKDWMLFHALDDAAPLLPSGYAQLHFQFHGHTLSGTPEQSPRWKRALAAVNADLGDAVGKLYVAKYFPPASKAQVQQMVGNIEAAFDARIDALDWMSPATKARAHEKIATLKVGVGYPETWRDYSTLTIKPDDALGNHLRASEYEYRHQLAKLGAQVDRGEWWMTPQTVNAVNLPLQNALNFPAAILDAPFFDPQADAAVNYGSIGSIIGHEISHSFDSSGAEFDAQGRLANWWTPADMQHFQDATRKLAAQYDAYEVLPGLHINGEQTLAENIADVAGLMVAWVAYQKSLGGQPAPVIDGMTGAQRFFLAYAQSRRGKLRDAALRQQILTDGHSPGRWRAQTVRNLDAWYDAFPSKPGQALYLAPADRVHIW